jgi:KaiC/GvpD/RAD55 family RecA-like ATPase
MDSLREHVDTATTTLVCVPSMGTESRCADLLAAAGDDSTVLWVSFTRPPSACVEAYRAGYDTDAELSVIAVGDTAPADATPASVTVETVSTPDDLTGLGITLSQALSAHDDVVVCFDSLTVLLQYVDRETAYEFLNAVTGHLYATDATAHFHLDPAALDTETIDALASLFDAVAEREDGEWSVHKRKLLHS